MANFCSKIRFLRISHPSMLSPVHVKAYFACAASAIISKSYSNRLHAMTGIYDGVIVPVILEFTGCLRYAEQNEL